MDGQFIDNGVGWVDLVVHDEIDLWSEWLWDQIGGSLEKYGVETVYGMHRFIRKVENGDQTKYKVNDLLFERVVVDCQSE